MPREPGDYYHDPLFGKCLVHHDRKTLLIQIATPDRFTVDITRFSNGVTPIGNTRYQLHLFKIGQ
jgi:hypothetical protein